MTDPFNPGGLDQGGDTVGGNPDSPNQGGQVDPLGGRGDIDLDTESMRDIVGAEHEFGGDSGFDAKDNVRSESADGAIQDFGSRQRAQDKQDAYEAKVAEMEAAHANGEPYLWGTETRDGEEIEIWKLVDGSTVYYDRDSETVIELEWPPGEGPVYQGNMMYNGEAVTAYELPDGTMVLVDENQTTVGYGDDIVSDTFVDPIFGEVYAIPDGPPDYDTTIYDADTGEAVLKIDTGMDTVVVTDYADAEMEVFSRYYPPGADYYLLIDGDGTIIDQIEIEPEEVLDIFGVLTVYDDGNVVIDVGVAVLQVDIIGPDGGISLEVGAAGDIFESADWLGAVEAGMEWDEEGFEAWARADVLGVGSFGAGIDIGTDGFQQWVEAEGDIGGVAFDASARWGMTEDGQMFAGGEIGFEMKIGLLDLEGNVNGYVEAGPSGFEMTGGWDGKVGMLGAFVEGGQQLSIVLDEDGTTITGEEYRGIGIEGLGSVRLGGEVQLHTDGTKDGTSLTGGGYASVNDADGDERGMIGVYSELDATGLSKPWVQDEHLDTRVSQESYDRHHGDDDDSGIPAGPDGSADYRDEFPESGSTPDIDFGRPKAGQPRDVFDAVARPTQTNERDLGLDERREPIGAAGGNKANAASASSDDTDDTADTDDTGGKGKERPEIEVKRDPNAPDPKPTGDGPVLAGPDYDPTAPRPPINTERVWDGPGDDDDDLVGDKAGPGTAGGGRPGDGPPVIHLTDDASASMSAAPPPAPPVEPADHEFLSSGSGTPTVLRATDEQVDLAPDVTPFKSVADSMTARPRGAGAAEGESGLPWKGTADSVTARPRGRDVGRDVGSDVGSELDDADDASLDADIPADDITTMVTGEGAGGGTDQLEVGRAAVRIDPSLADRVERMDTDTDTGTDTDTDTGTDADTGTGTGTSADAVAQVETAIPAVVVPDRDLEPMFEPEPIEPESIEPEPMPEPEPAHDEFDDALLDDQLDD